MRQWVVLGWFLVVSITSANARDLGSIKCFGGGDGPNPLMDLTHLQDLGVTGFETQGEIQEFVLWESKGSVVYRNSEGKIYQLALNGGKNTLLAKSRWPISRVKEDTNTFLALRDRAVTLDTGFSPPRWQTWAYKNGLRHLYWHRFLGTESLFSVASSFVRPHQQRIEVYSFSRKGVKPHICNLFSNQGEFFHLGEGHQYPHVFLYKVKKEGDSTRLSYYNIQIEGEIAKLPVCRLYQAGQYSTLIPGNVREVYSFPDLMTTNTNLFVVRTDHPERNLLWDDGIYGCRYYHLENREPIVLNPKHAMIAVWSDSEGLSIIYTRKFEKGEPIVIRPLRDLIEGPIKKEHLALSNNGKELFVLARPRGSQTGTKRQLMRVTLP